MQLLHGLHLALPDRLDRQLARGRRRPIRSTINISWNELPPQHEIAAASEAGDAVEAMEDEVGALLAEARKGLGGKSVAPAFGREADASILYNRAQPGDRDGAPAIIA